MKNAAVAFLFLALTIAAVGGARAVAGGAFRPAAAAGPDAASRASDPSLGSSASDGTLAAPDPVSAPEPAPSVPAPVVEAPVESPAAAPLPVAVPASVAAPAPPVAPVRAPAPAVAAPAAVPAAPPPPTCAATWFCYPRLGIAGPIVPYSDCLGSTDIGPGIRSFSCISPFYLMGHAYTQFGAITGWQAGDVVFASGRRFVISTAFVQNSCEPPAGAIAAVSLQTSLSSGGCGRVLIVQGR